MTFFSSLTRHWVSYPFRNSAQQSALLRKMVDRIRTSLELRVVLQTAVDEVADLLKLDRCIFFWHFKDLQQVQVVCERLNNEQPSCLGYHPLTTLGSAAPLINRGEVVISAGRVSGFSRWLSQLIQPPAQTTHTQPIFGAKASLLVPVRGRERSIGFIACLADESRQWSVPEVEFIQLIAQRLEIAVRQAQLYEKMQKQAQREKLINQITTQTRQSLDLKTILTKAIAHLQKALEVDRCLVHLVENLGDECESSSEYYEPGINQTIFRRKHLFEVCRPPYPPAFRDFNTDGPITKWVIRTRQQVVIPDITQDPRIGADNIEYRLAQIKSSLVVPVRANGTLQAILYLNQCSHVRYWSRDDQKLAQAVADQLAISIKQAYLYSQSRQQAAESAEHARSLTETLKHLQHVQAQLIQSEKMSSLGQMVAGIAHEINNPVSFIYGNIPYVEQYVQDLLRLLNAYERQCPQASDELKELIREIELDFLMKDLPRILSSMQVGANRIREIVLSLRSFSRLDEAHCKVADVNAGLDDTLSVLQNHIKADVQIIRNYSKLPRVECYPRQLNQVFMNLLMNAIEALNHPQPDSKVITITTENTQHDVTQEPWVRITITDNGCGIDDDIQPKIFEPFFTTKKTGQGAGLGLAVSYQTIVNQHQGFLGVESELGQGSTFVIEIPVKHSDLRVRNRNLYLFSGVNPPQRTNVEVAIAKRDLS